MKKLILSALILLIGSPAFAINRGDIRDQIRQIINDTGPSDSVRYSDAELNTKINIIQRDIAIKTDAIQYRSFIDVSTDTAVYYLEDDINAIKVMRVYYRDSSNAGTYYPLTYTTRERLAQELWNYESAASGRPLEFYQVNYTTFNTAGFGVGVWPAPDGDYTGGLRVDYSALPVNMNSDTDIPFSEHPGLIGYNHLIIYGVVMITDRNLAGVYRDLYNEGLSFMIQNLKDLPAREGPVRPRR